MRSDKFISGKKSSLEFILRDWRPLPGDFSGMDQCMTCISVPDIILQSPSGSSPSPLPFDHPCQNRSKKQEQACFEWGPEIAQFIVSSLVSTLNDLKKRFPTPFTQPHPFVSDDLDMAVDALIVLATLIHLDYPVERLLRLPSIKKK